MNHSGSFSRTKVGAFARLYRSGFQPIAVRFSLGARFDEFRESCDQRQGKTSL